MAIKGSRPIKVYNIITNTSKIYTTLGEVIKAINIPQSALYKCLKTGQNFGNYKFMDSCYEGECLCFSCANAYVDKCIKIAEGKYVPGSKIAEGDFNNKIVIDCPRFISDRSVVRHK